MSEKKQFDSPEVRKLWHKQPEVLTRFMDESADHRQLCDEVDFILRKRLKAAGLEFASLTSRIKTVKSFAEKIVRKGYTDPFREVTDRAGVRLVYLFPDDHSVIDAIIRQAFDVVERIDKTNERGGEKYGYDAVHYVVKLSPENSGARFEDLKDFVCEIQTRTVLQDAWAIIDHHLFYKKRQAAPPFLKLQMNSLAGFIAAADNNFEVIRQERDRYREQLIELDADSSAFLDQDTNTENVRALLQKRFSNLRTESSSGHISNLLEPFVVRQYPKVRDVDSLLERTREAREHYVNSRGSLSAAGEFAVAIALDFPDFRDAGWDPEDIVIFEELEELVE